jgi:hypothetical protein
MEHKGLKPFYDPSIGCIVHPVSCGGEGSRDSEAFIPPIPLKLVLALQALPGKALQIFLILWRESVMRRSVTVKLTTTEARSWGLSRYQKRHALQTLQAAGWVRVQAAQGKNPFVTLCLHVSPWAFQRKKSR